MQWLILFLCFSSGSQLFAETAGPHEGASKRHEDNDVPTERECKLDAIELKDILVEDSQSFRPKVMQAMEDAHKATFGTATVGQIARGSARTAVAAVSSDVYEAPRDVAATSQELFNRHNLLFKLAQSIIVALRKPDDQVKYCDLLRNVSAQRSNTLMWLSSLMTTLRTQTTTLDELNAASLELAIEVAGSLTGVTGLAGRLFLGQAARVAARGAATVASERAAFELAKQEGLEVLKRFPGLRPRIERAARMFRERTGKTDLPLYAREFRDMVGWMYREFNISVDLGWKVLRTTI